VRIRSILSEKKLARTSAVRRMTRGIRPAQNRTAARRMMVSGSSRKGVQVFLAELDLFGQTIPQAGLLKVLYEV